jgi:SWI/SNF-related matrix-associated actin-dependent regulator of chromatin subfamily A member 5
MLSPARLEEISKTESLATIRRRRRELKAPTASAAKGTAQQMRNAHNDEIKRAVVESAFFRWSYMVRKTEALESFISESAKNKLHRFKELLRMNNLEELSNPSLDEDDAALSGAIDQARKTLKFSETPAPFVGQDMPQPTAITGTLRAYQRRGLAWLVRMYENGCNAVLADEMGLGKTLQTISFITHLKDVMHVGGPFLVIVPLSVLTNWANEFRKWAPALKVVKLHSSSREERDRRKKEVLNNFRDFDVVVTTYEMIVSPNMKNVLTSKIWWRCVVIDEGHKIKNDETSLSQTVRSMNCQYRLLLTGTPLQNNLHELWAMLNFLDPVLFDSSDKFDSGFDLSKDLVDRELLSKAHYLLRPFCLRRTKAEVESKLPPKEEIVVNVPLSEMQVFWYKRLILNDADLLERVEDQVISGGPGTNSPVPSSSPTPEAEEDAAAATAVSDWKRLQSLMMQLRKCCNHPYLFPGAEPDFDGSTSDDLVQASGKLQTLDLLLKKLQERGHRVVIFSQFTSMLDILSDFLRLRDYKHARLDGSTNRVQRAVDVLQYNQADSSHFAYLMSTRAGGLGINLATADTVILYDSDWNPQVDLQAMDRVHRIGQEKPVHVYRLVTKGTIEERIVQRAKKKLFLDSMVNRGSTAQGEALETLSKAEMLKMLKFGASAVFGGENGDAQVKLLTDHELNKMVDRSEAAMKERTTSADTSSAASQDNAHDFDMEKIQPVRLRDMYGKDFVQEATAAGTLSTESAASPTQERPVKKARVSSAKKKKEADPVESVQDIAKQWNSTKGASTKSGRKVKSRFTKVGGHNVLHANTYSLEEGEKSVFASELANRRRGPDAATLEEINRSLGRGRQVAGRDYTNEQHCLSCWDGGELILCDQCPVAVHPECLNADQAPPAQRKGTPT